MQPLGGDQVGDQTDVSFTIHTFRTGAQVISQGETTLQAFVPSQLANCQPGSPGCQDNIDKSEGSFALLGSSSELFYPKSGAQESGLTCCGMRVMTPFERLLAWAGAVGGFAALLKGLLIGVGNGFVAICPKKKKTLDDAAGLGGAL